jgi:hypothetical protein
MRKVILILFSLSLFISSCKKNNKSAYVNAKENYGEEIKQLAIEFDLPYEYLMALVVLECSGANPIEPRFEKHVYKKLKLFRDGDLNRFENLNKESIKDASDEALENLAKSWGPFQLMGYKCLKLGVKINDIRGDNSLYWGVYWINKEYGDYLRRNKLEQAFRIHNTGSPSGATYNSRYVRDGLKHIKYFKK